MVDLSKIKEDSVAEYNVNYGELAQKVSEENINKWPRDNSYNILVKNVAAFCPCLKNLPEAKVKRLRLVSRGNLKTV